MRLIAATTALLLATFAGNAVAADSAAPELTRADVDAWLDGFVPYAMSTGDIAGGVIVVVKDGEVLAQKGYGYADVAAKKPVDPERTMFRAGSVAKLVVHTAVMQLVEQGKLDLDADIQQYLDFPVPDADAFGKPVTLHNLMTHTGGFEELVRGLMASDPKVLMPLETYVKATKPTRIFPPGEVPSYCNYCVTLEGYIVQRVSGESFDDYLDKHIFAPLGMSNSTFRQPLPKQFAEQMSTGYRTASQPPGYFELVGPAPAGSLSTTGADMARFMIAQMQAYSGRRLDAAAGTKPRSACRRRCSGRCRRAWAWPSASSSAIATAIAFASTAATRSSSTASSRCSWTTTSASSCRSTAPAKKAPWARFARRYSRSSPIATSRRRSPSWRRRNMRRRARGS